MLIPKCCKGCQNRKNGICNCTLPLYCNEWIEDDVTTVINTTMENKMGKYVYFYSYRICNEMLEETYNGEGVISSTDKILTFEEFNVVKEKIFEELKHNNNIDEGQLQIISFNLIGETK